MTIPTFTAAHLAPLRLHVDGAGNPRRPTDPGHMTDAWRDCIALRLIDVDGWNTTITPAGIALLQAVSLTD